MADKKPRFEEYPKWMKKQFGKKLAANSETYYRSVANIVRADFSDSGFWKELLRSMPMFRDEYLVETSYPLFIQVGPALETKLEIKPFDSFLRKTYRKNILNNKNWPEEPPSGWITPDNWYSKINDMVRTLFAVKYLDGVKFLVDKIESLGQQHGLECRVDFEAKEEGYYAAHVYVTPQFVIPTMSWKTEQTSVDIEMQITTQLQEVIRQLLHKYYAEKRCELRAELLKWQWDYKCDEFSANYLGHVLHYVEGMIMEIRDKEQGGGRKHEEPKILEVS